MMKRVYNIFKIVFLNPGAFFFFRKRRGLKGFSQIDFIIAMGIFLVIFGTVVQFTTNFFINMQEGTEIMALRSHAIDLMDIADMGFVPENWSLSSYPRKIGLQTKAYRFYINVSNTLAGAVEYELVTFNYSELGFADINYNSTVLYNENNETVAYQINGSNITFVTNISAGQEQWFTVYFDDDSNFTSMSSQVSGTDNLTETLYPIEDISLLQYRKIIKLNSSVYGLMKNSTDIKTDFRITLLNEANATFFDYGAAVPKTVNIISLRRPVLFQNSTAGIRYGNLFIRVW